MERERLLEKEPIQKTKYEQMLEFYQKWQERQKNGELVVHGNEKKYVETRQGWLKYYLSPFDTETALDSWTVFEHDIRTQSGRHRHQGGIIIYVLEGTGISEVDGKYYDWKAGDLLLLPIQQNGVAHQHWNKDANSSCKWIAFRDMLVAPYIANAIDQLQESSDITGKPAGKMSGSNHNDWKVTVNGDQVPLVTSPEELASVNLFDRLIDLRDKQRSRLNNSTSIIRGDELPWELNAHGKMQWYLHPCIAYTCVQTHVFYRQEIPVGSRSGVQRHGGDVVFYILQGQGYTEVDGVKYNWQASDVMTLPIHPDGVIYRHVNTGNEPVLLIGMERNMVHTVGVDRQCGFEELQPCLEYRQK